MRVFIDTDPGIDDALAILAALGGPGLEVAGITTVAGNVGLGLTTRNAGRLLAVAGRPDIPVVPGAERPLARDPLETGWVHGADGLGGADLPDPLKAPLGDHAPDWLAARLAEAPARILALGPMTNLARLLDDHPQAAARIEGITAMGGAIAAPGNVGTRAEFNIAWDPEAAAIVIGSGVPLTLVSLDVTRQVRAGRDWVGALGGSAAAGAAAALLGRYFADEGGESRPLHDPCVVLHALAPELFEGRRLRLSVGPDGALDGIADPGGTEVLGGIDAAAALDLLAARLRGA